MISLYHSINSQSFLKKDLYLNLDFLLDLTPLYKSYIIPRVYPLKGVIYYLYKLISTRRNSSGYPVKSPQLRRSNKIHYQIKRLRIQKIYYDVNIMSIIEDLLFLLSPKQGIKYSKVYPRKQIKERKRKKVEK